MSVLEIAKIQIRRGEELQTGIPRLDPGEFGWAEDTENLYIGKRIIEGGANDENTRILTENDLNFFRLITSNTGTAASSYLYRQDVSTLLNPIDGYLTHTVGTNIQTKLDQYVSLVDFGVNPNSYPVDITLDLENAIQDLFFNNNWNDWRREDTRRTLLIPAGNYLISNVINLPPYTKLVGEGVELTKLILTSSNTEMFKTVDALGRKFEDGNMESGVKRSRNIHIEGMTLAFNDNSSNNSALLSLDNTLDATVEDVLFKTNFSSTSTTTFGMTTFGTGIQIRGTGGGIGSGDTNLCENIRLHRCKFDGMNKGISAHGSIIRPVISNSVFSNLHLGVEFTGEPTIPGPMNGHIFQNRFENIVSYGILVDPGTPTPATRGNNISENNLFVQVGNGVALNDNITVSAYPIISFKEDGNSSINDFFQRKVVADAATEVVGGFYYNPLVSAKSAVISDNHTYFSTVSAASTGSVTKIPSTDANQIIDVRYQLTSNSLSRKGHLMVNVADSTGTTAFASLSDSYNFVEELETKISDFSTVYPSLFFASVSDIVASSSTEPMKVTTTTPHNLLPGSPIVIYHTVGMDALQEKTYYISVIGTQTNQLFLWKDEDLSQPLDGMGFDFYVSGGELHYSLPANQFAVNLTAYPAFEGLIGPSPYPNHPIAMPAGWYVTADNVNFACITDYIISTTINGDTFAIFNTQALATSQISFNTAASWKLLKSNNDGVINGDSNIKFEVATNLASSTSQNYMVLKCKNESLEDVSISYQISTQL